jgi:hypothetical protein
MCVLCISKTYNLVPKGCANTCLNHLKGSSFFTFFHDKIFWLLTVTNCYKSNYKLFLSRAKRRGFEGCYYTNMVNVWGDRYDT